MAGFAPHWRWARGTARNGKRQGVPEKLTDQLVRWFANPFRVFIVNTTHANTSNTALVLSIIDRVLRVLKLVPTAVRYLGTRIYKSQSTVNMYCTSEVP